MNTIFFPQHYQIQYIVVIFLQKLFYYKDKVYTTAPGHAMHTRGREQHKNSKASTKHKHSLLLMPTILIAPTILFSLRIRYDFLLIRKLTTNFVHETTTSHKLETNWERVSRIARFVLQTGLEVIPWVDRSDSGSKN